MILQIRKKRAWRHHLDECRARRQKALRYAFFIAMAAAEGLWLRQAQDPAAGRIRWNLTRREEVYEVELISENEAEQEPLDDVYGVRFRPGSLEFQFYHIKESVRER